MFDFINLRRFHLCRPCHCSQANDLACSFSLTHEVPMQPKIYESVGYSKMPENAYVYYLPMVLRDSRMTEVIVTRKGQTTIPAELRAKYRIEEGSRLEVIDLGNGIVFRPKKSFLDLAGSGAEKATVAEMKRLLDKLREEDV